MKQHHGNIYFVEDGFDEKVAATLTIDGDNYTVEFQADKYKSVDYKIIQGEFIDLGFVTFIECYHSGYTSSIVRLIKYRIEHIITTIKFNNYDSITATRLNVKMNCLQDWMGQSNLKGSLVFEGIIEYKKRENLILHENAEYMIKVNFHLNERRQRNESLTITEYCELEIQSKKKSKDIFEMYNIYKKFKIFLGFIGIFSDTQDKFYFKEDGNIYENQTDPILMNFYTKKFDTNNKGLLVHERILYKDVKENLNSILGEWINNIKIQESIILVMEKYTFIKLTVETYFLNTCFAIETFHRKNKFNKVLSDSAFKKIKDGIRSKLESDLEISFFNDKLIYANEPTFKDRLTSLKSEFTAITLQDFDIVSYIEKIVKTRNYLVHRGSNSNTFVSLEMYYAAIYLETLTKYCIMEIIGIDKNILDKKFINTGFKINQFYDINVNKSMDLK